MLILLFLLLLSLPVAAQPCVAVCAREVFQLGGTTVVIKNNLASPVTLNIQFRLENLALRTLLPPLTVLNPSSTLTLELRPVKLGFYTKYAYWYNYQLGDYRVRHDASYRYGLPFAPGKTYRVMQGFDGTFSHTGQFRYCVDWDMVVGTPVYAARPGVVVQTRSDSTVGGTNQKRFINDGNFVRIIHADGTIGEYHHLVAGGVLVKPGQAVARHQPIGKSGNTGWSKAPHLHFCVSSPTDSVGQKSWPIEFITQQGTTITPITGEQYTAGLP